MAVQFQIDVFGDKQVSRAILRKGARIRNSKPLWRSLIPYLEEKVEQNFDTEGRRASGGWAALKPETIRRKQAKGQSTKILEATGALRASLTKSSAPGAIRKIKMLELQYGSRKKYGVHHQFGAPDANVPMRKPVEFRASDRKRITKKIQRFVMTGEISTGEHI